jgi:hypothetical protein
MRPSQARSHASQYTVTIDCRENLNDNASASYGKRPGKGRRDELSGADRNGAPAEVVAGTGRLPRISNRQCSPIRTRRKHNKTNHPDTF